MEPPVVQPIPPVQHPPHPGHGEEVPAPMKRRRSTSPDQVPAAEGGALLGEGLRAGPCQGRPPWPAGALLLQSRSWGSRRSQGRLFLFLFPRSRAASGLVSTRLGLASL